MREIKFRAWDKTCKKWLSIPIKRIDDEYDCSVLVQELPSIEIMQFTGLKDKNGKEIFEGDIVEDIITKEIGKIEFGHPYNQGFHCRIEKDFNGVGVDKSSWFILTTENSKELEVIGNIYENQELLEENK